MREALGDPNRGGVAVESGAGVAGRLADVVVVAKEADEGIFFSGGTPAAAVVVAEEEEEQEQKRSEFLAPRPPPPAPLLSRTRSLVASRRVNPEVYMWTEGCANEGGCDGTLAEGPPPGWQGENAAATGRFLWSSSGGEICDGCWCADCEDGFGRKHYANGDFYEGNWRRNLQEGRGRYVWRNGNQYIGQWRGGVISGHGVLIWSNGCRYDGEWENGVPRGSGIFTWPNGSSYVGCWSRELMDFYHHRRRQLPRRSNPNPKQAPFFVSSPSSPARKRFSLDGALVRVSHAEKNLPRICIWESDGEAGDITCEIIDTFEASMMCRMGKSPEEEANVGSKGADRQLQRSPCFSLGSEAKKPGETISKGHKNYDLMLNLQLGIRYSVGKLASLTQMRDLRQGDFDPKEKFWTRFPPEGSKITPPHQSVEFRWKDYCPMVFRHLRRLFAVDPADYMLAICGSDALRELSSPGKSGSFFYLTQDDRFIIKTVKKSEVKVLIKMLPSYFQHVCQYKSSLVTKFYGVHCVKPIGGQKVRFIVMGNLFCSEFHIHRRFDLKGSSHGRMTDKPEGEIDETTTLKDLDLNFVFRLHKIWFEELMGQIDRDCEFLEAEGIMDYSLLVGLHFCGDISSSKTSLSACSSSPCRLSRNHSDSSRFHGRRPLIRLGANMPARAEQSGHGGETFEVILYFGIIDILQDYDISKKLEHAYKSLQADPSSISAVDPKLYSRRFRDFIRRIFVEDR
ncbi:unnamed protein product [Spirodela intermedia]|uniref:Phosphatidylinositol 4-phosphate 5-kinase n=1 Tax=Spirodela intermedia TaxID=51605 RepID=A0A7I8KDA4_SPIIN|nr:unnamed protein product [Spirodela intermedia]